jgi:hypothetical protein
MLREFWCETESVCERHGERQRQTNGDCCPVPLFGTGRYRTNDNVENKVKRNFERRPPQNKKQAGASLFSTGLLRCCSAAGALAAFADVAG